MAQELTNIINLSTAARIAFYFLPRGMLLQYLRCNKSFFTAFAVGCKPLTTCKFYFLYTRAFLYAPSSFSLFSNTFCFSWILDFSECIIFHIRTRADMKYYARVL